MQIIYKVYEIIVQCYKNKFYELCNVYCASIFLSFAYHISKARLLSNQIQFLMCLRLDYIACPLCECNYIYLPNTENVFWYIV